MYVMYVDTFMMRLPEIRITGSNREQHGKMYRKILSARCAEWEKTSFPKLSKFSGKRKIEVELTAALYSIKLYGAAVFCANSVRITKRICTKSSYICTIRLKLICNIETIWAKC